MHFSIIEDEENRETIRWNNEFDSIIILNPTLFSSVVLPLHFKHSKFASFVRQLNKHNFHRVKLPPDNEYGEHVRFTLHLDYLCLGVCLQTSYVSKR
jgi:osomolarity two-component system response regulator SKN7